MDMKALLNNAHTRCRITPSDKSSCCATYNRTERELFQGGIASVSDGSCNPLRPLRALAKGKWEQVGIAMMFSSLPHDTVMHHEVRQLQMGVFSAMAVDLAQHMA